MNLIYNEKIYYRWLIILGIFIFLVLFNLRGGTIGLAMLGIVFSAAGITLLIDLIVIKILVWKYFPDWFYKLKITNSPFLGGEWKGTLESDHVIPETNQKVPPFEVTIYITHNFDSIRIRMFSEKSYSTSYIAGITIDSGEQKYLNYIYSNDADKDRELNPKHDGAARLRIVFKEDIKLEGHYWTGRKTLGTMTFIRKSRKNPKI